MTRKPRPTFDASFLGVDIHSHLVPGIDDGAKDLADSLSLIRGLADIGYKKIITTPHIMSEYYPNTPDGILGGLAQVKSAMAQHSIEMEIEAAAEYFLDEEFSRLLASDEDLITFGGNQLLIEFFTLTEPLNAQDTIFAISARGLQPVLAHPERYLYYTDEFSKFEQFKAAGCYFQINLLSLAGHYGPEQKKLALRLLKAGMVDYLGSDLHHQRHLDKIKSLDRSTVKLLEGYSFRNKELMK
ncbi:MAG: CpsB/CapC family capsule biosynthesis tyrosine phosphatase [Bacteroidota bacterium]